MLASKESLRSNILYKTSYTLRQQKVRQRFQALVSSIISRARILKSAHNAICLQHVSVKSSLSNTSNAGHGGHGGGHRRSSSESGWIESFGKKDINSIRSTNIVAGSKGLHRYHSTGTL